MLVILIVEDDEAVRDAISGFVRSLGYTAASFGSGAAFLQSTIINETACLITDVRMPGMSGVDLQRHLLEHGYRIPTIFVTAFPEDSVRLRALNDGAIGFLGKPFDEDELIKLLVDSLKKSNVSKNAR